VSTYSTPDVSELNYHAGVSIYHKGEFAAFKAMHTGLQFLEESEDVLLTGSSFHACSHLSIDLSVVQFSEQELKDYI